MDNTENWAKADNPEVEAAKDAFAEAQKAEILRQQVSQYASAAVIHGHVDRGWTNAWLVRLGVQPIIAQSRYQINAPITGNYGTTVTAASRAEALKKFSQYVATVTAAGQVNGSTGGHCDGVYAVQFTGGEPVFYSGPEDIEASGAPVPGLDALKDGIRQMLKQGVAERGWGYSYAQVAVAAMDLEPLPELHNKTVTVPVSGTATVGVLVFDGDEDAAVQSAALATLGRMAYVHVKPEEIGTVLISRPDASGFTLVNDEDDDEDDTDDPY